MVYKNLVLSGGSSKGFSYIGVLQSLEEHNIIKNIKTFVGTSIGAIFSTLFSMGFTSKELYNHLDHNLELTDVNIENFFYKYGFYSGKDIMNFVENIIEKKYKKDITFSELNFLRNNKLVICVTNLNKHKIEYLSVDNYPTMKILDAIRFAITIPFIFTSKTNENTFFIDGAVIENISFYNLEPKNTIGILLINNNENNNKEINTLESFTYNLFLCMKKSYFNNYNSKYKVVPIICENIQSFDFQLSIDKKKELINCGYRSINNYLKKEK